MIELIIVLVRLLRSILSPNLPIQTVPPVLILNSRSVPKSRGRRKRGTYIVGLNEEEERDQRVIEEGG